MVKRAAVTLITVLVTLGGTIAPVLAQDVEPAPGDVEPRGIAAREMQAARSIPTGLADDALRYVFLEIAILEELDAFTPRSMDFLRANPLSDFEFIHSQYGRWPDTDHEQLLAVLDAIDTELATRAAAFRLLPEAGNPLLDFAVGRLPADWRARLTAGDTEFIQGFEYAGAMQTLVAAEVDTSQIDARDPLSAFEPVILALSTAMESLADSEELNRLLTAEVADLQAEVAALAETPRPGARTASTTSWTTWIVASGGALLVLLLVAMIITARISARRRSADHTKTDAMEAHRLLSATRTELDIARVAAEIGANLTGAHGAALLRRTPDGLRPAGQPEVLVSSGLGRVVDAGQPLETRLSNDPFLPGIDAEVVAVPVVNNASIIAVLAAWNVGTTKLAKTTRTNLEMVSPALGGALVRVDEMGTMEKMAMVDGLTSLGNRRRLDGDLESTLGDAVRSGLQVGFAMIDVDHFKNYNDTHGHTAGDVALQKVAATIARCVRDSDVVYRYGGEEFSMLLPGATPEEVVAVAERVRAAVESMDVAGEHLQPSGKLTVSIGVATLESGHAGDIKERADAALYRAKSGGRNTVVVD